MATNYPKDTPVASNRWSTTASTLIASVSALVSAMGFALAIRQAIVKPGLLTAFLFMVGIGFAFFLAVAIQEWHSQAYRRSTDFIGHPDQVPQAEVAEESVPQLTPEQQEPAP